MPKKVSRDTYPAGLEDCDGRCGAVPEQMRVDRLPEGFAGSLGDYMGDRISGKRTAFCADPDSVMPVGSSREDNSRLTLAPPDLRIGGFCVGELSR
jgi:hypothetical protein